jgi:hypothetical protein
MIPLSNRTSPIDFEIVIIFMFGSDCYGKKQPAFTYSRALNLSTEPIN